jgi:5-methylcytosine-specific restriction endonuclease McrA
MDRPLCNVCNIKKTRISDYRKDGSIRFKKKCDKCSPNYKKKLARKAELKRTRKYGGYHKKSFCEYCSFKALDSCQLDVDHIDGNHKNNNLDNLQTLCANCHRLKTKVNKEFGPKGNVL